MYPAGVIPTGNPALANDGKCRQMGGMNTPRLPRRRFLESAAALALSAPLARWTAPAASPAEEPDRLGRRNRRGHPDPLIPAPADPAAWPEWRRQLAAWRTAVRRELSYDDALYRRADFAWAQHCFACAFVLMNDLAFYEPESARFTVDAFLRHGRAEFGGYDALVLWHAYPRIGFDARNQFDFYRDMPGGLTGLRALSQACHAQGVRVFVDYNPWDTGTRREGQGDVAALAELVRAIDADGIFLDTLDQGAAEFRARLDAARPGVVLEGELALALAHLHDHHLSWAQGFADSPVPGVLRNKWVERRHLQHQIQRWNRDHSGELHSAWMNGSGMMIWENVFGSWVGWNPRDRATLRAMLGIQRRYAAVFSEEDWTPLVPTELPGVFASRWAAGGLQLWTLVNRTTSPVAGGLIALESASVEPVYDLIQGRPATLTQRAGRTVIEGALAARGIGAFVQGPPDALGPAFAAFLSEQAELHARTSQDTTFPEQRVALRPAPANPATTRVPEGMIELPPTQLTLSVEFRIRECGGYESVPPAGGAWGPLHQPTVLTRIVDIARCAIDRTPVTNAAFAQFLKTSGYAPRARENFLKHWVNGAPPAGHEDHPVVYVSLEDARAYAAWAGKRLPSEEEWQYAAGGPEQRRYPWGDAMAPGLCNDGRTGGTTAVTAFPAGRSPFGCLDLCGNVWHWTESERSDGRTRFCVLKGGSWFQARGSDWYADGGPKPCRFAAKFLLMWPGLDRCATIGFRCACTLAS